MSRATNFLQDGIAFCEHQRLPADGWLTTKQVGDAANQGTDTAHEVLEDMWLLHLIDRSGERVHEWAVCDETRHLLTRACIELPPEGSKVN